MSPSYMIYITSSTAIINSGLPAWGSATLQYGQQGCMYCTWECMCMSSLALVYIARAPG